LGRREFGRIKGGGEEEMKKRRREKVRSGRRKGVLVSTPPFPRVRRPYPNATGKA